MTQLAQYLGNLIRERGGTLPSHDQWLEEKANEVRQIVSRKILKDEIVDEKMFGSIILNWNINESKN